MTRTFKSLLTASAMVAGVGFAVVAHATAVTIDTAGIYDPGLVVATGVVNATEYSSAVEFGVTEGSGPAVETLYAFCVDLTHQIYVGFDEQAGHDIVSAKGDAQSSFSYAYQTGTLSQDSVGGGSGTSGTSLTPTQIGEIGGLADFGRGLIAFANPTTLAQSQTLSDELAAVQGAIWRIEYPSPDTFTGSRALDTLMDAYVAAAPRLAVHGAVTTLYAADGSSQGFVIGSAPAHDAFLDDLAAVPEPASWALMIAGFGLAGATLRRRRAHVAGAAI